MKKTTNKFFIVEHHFSYGWDDAGWTKEVKIKGKTLHASLTFPSKAEAQAEIKDHVQSCKEAFKNGCMDDAPKMKDFRIVEIHPVNLTPDHSTLEKILK